ncbi:ABC transporter permease [Nonomuraea typhae]|uniref:ABC transporter permease n=1 Tax=Nonomuraea typhae TaxID=2603600 RepID=A0ABW7YUA2_9ACTN
MIWLTWRQFRATAAMMVGVLGVLAGALALTGPGVADDYASGLASCTRDGTCLRFFDRFFDDYQIPFLAVTAFVLILPALIGLFWGAPLITRELESGTYLLVWNQSITRSRWLAVKIAIPALAAVAAAGLCSLVVGWWSGPLDRSAAGGYGLMDPLVFGARGIAPMGYAVFGFVLGVTVGMLVRHTLPAMALTLVLFALVQLGMPLLVRAHLIPPVSGTFELSQANMDQFGVRRDGSPTVILDTAIPGDTGAWVLSSRLLDPSGRTIAESGAEAPVQVSATSGPCAPPGRPEPEGGLNTCVEEVNRLGYRQAATYQPFARFWTFQWLEIGIYTLFSLGLTGFCFWWLRRRRS